MDWSLTGALAGVTIVVGVVGYGTLTLLGSGASLPIAPPPPVLLPARERPAVVVSPIPDSPAAPTHTAIWGDPAPGAASVAGSASSSTLQDALSDGIGEHPAPNPYGRMRQQRRDFQRNPAVDAARAIPRRAEQVSSGSQVVERELEEQCLPGLAFLDLGGNVGVVRRAALDSVVEDGRVRRQSGD